MGEGEGGGIKMRALSYRTDEDEEVRGHGNPLEIGGEIGLESNRILCKQEEKRVVADVG